MEKFPIGIIGGTGGMGKWFASFFQREGYPVEVSGRRTGPDAGQMAEHCPVVMVSVPMEATDQVIRTVGPLMKSDSLLVDLTSLKVAPVRAMLESSISEVIGLHPLFAVCPARGERWLSWLKVIMERNGAILVETTPEEHDKMMALVQALNHFNNLMLGLTLAGQDVSLEELQRFSTPLFRDRLDHLNRIISHPELYAGLIAGNPRTGNLLSLYERNLAELQGLICQGDINALKERIAGMTSLQKPEKR
jgi:prephenate dehydrogenase